ncbi:hypothetical protein DRN72_02615 [Methanosarcinales archaeon]|nr:MAG: hypothetical protein DRN72_02615 [Methanosarcinales archaeon]
MRAHVECAYCGEKTVFDATTTLELHREDERFCGEVVDLKIMNTQKFEDFMRDVRWVALELFAPEKLENGVDKEFALRMLRRCLGITLSLSYEVLDFLKSELGLYEKDGKLYEA